MISMMMISIGIFAHNEEARIAQTIASLKEQDIFCSDHSVEVVVLPNGCRDRTSEVAAAALQRHFLDRPRVRARVHALAEPGKSRTWNRFVHEIADSQADYLVFMDGDIELVGTATLRLLIEALEAHPEAHAAVDTILKDIERKSAQGFRERLSAASSELTKSGPPKLAGSLYALRGAVARSIHLPPGLLVEDGFLKAMICTDNFTRDENPARLVHTEGAAHVFEAVTDIRKLLRHEVRLMVGSAMNFILFDELRRRVKETGADAGALIGEANRADPDWAAKCIDRALANRRGFLAPTGFILLPFRQLRNFPIRKAVLRLPAAFIRSTFNAVAAVMAHRQLKKREFRW